MFTNRSDSVLKDIDAMAHAKPYQDLAEQATLLLRDENIAKYKTLVSPATLSMYGEDALDLAIETEYLPFFRNYQTLKGPTYIVDGKDETGEVYYSFFYTIIDATGTEKPFGIAITFENGGHVVGNMQINATYQG